MLTGSNLVMAGLGRNSKLPEFRVQVSHIFCDPGPQSSEVVVILLLALRASCSEKGASCKPQVLSLSVVLFIYKEIFLLSTDCGDDSLHVVLSEKGEDLYSFIADGLHTSQ